MSNFIWNQFLITQLDLMLNITLEIKRLVNTTILSDFSIKYIETICRLYIIELSEVN